MESVTHVRACEDFSLLLTFDNGELRRFDMRPYLDKGNFAQLQDPARFLEAFVEADTVCWPGELDMAPETLYDLSVPEQVAKASSVHEPKLGSYSGSS